jgi:hypothetical protein
VKVETDWAFYLPYGVERRLVMYDNGLVEEQCRQSHFSPVYLGGMWPPGIKLPADVSSEIVAALNGRSKASAPAGTVGIGHLVAPVHFMNGPAPTPKMMAEAPCDHSFKPYVGLVEKYEYCTKCDHKRK